MDACKKTMQGFFLLFMFLTAMLHAQVSHESWDRILKKYVNDYGNVNYRGFSEEDKQRLNDYLAMFAAHLPSDSWAMNAQKAYWINAYNALTVKLILDHYPVKSIRDLHPLIYIPQVHTVWHFTWLIPSERLISLNEIEHERLRKLFDDPRIHFAINCASKSCPKLRNEAYLPEKIDHQLNLQATYFINHPYYNEISPGHVRLSKLFDWFESDFTRETSLVRFLNQYASIVINARAKVEFKEYNWKLNE